MLLFTPLALLKILHYATQTYQHLFFSLKYYNNNVTNLQASNMYWTCRDSCLLEIKKY